MNKVLALDRSWSWLLAVPFLLPLPSSNIPTLVASVPFAVSVTARKRIAKMLYYGTFEGFPAVWDPGADDGLVLWKNSEGWRKIGTVELNHNAGVMSKEKFEKAFPKLPPLTKLAS